MVLSDQLSRECRLLRGWLTLCMCDFVEAETNSILVKNFPYYVPSLWRDVVVLLPKDLVCAFWVRLLCFFF